MLEKQSPSQGCFKLLDPKLHVVLFEPEIPQNTGSIGRLCLATQTKLHLIEPLGFDMSDRALKRAGLDYWQDVDWQVYPNFESFVRLVGDESRFVFFSKRAGKTLYDYSFKKNTYLIFGKETQGLPDWVLGRYSSQLLRIPLYDARVRSLNLSNAASIGVYEALRQIDHLSFLSESIASSKSLSSESSDVLSSRV